MEFYGTQILVHKWELRARILVLAHRHTCLWHMVGSVKSPLASLDLSMLVWC